MDSSRPILMNYFNFFIIAFLLYFLFLSLLFQNYRQTNLIFKRNSLKKLKLIISSFSLIWLPSMINSIIYKNTEIFISDGVFKFVLNTNSIYLVVLKHAYLKLSIICQYTNYIVQENAFFSILALHFIVGSEFIIQFLWTLVDQTLTHNPLLFSRFSLYCRALNMQDLSQKEI